MKRLITTAAAVFATAALAGAASSSAPVTLTFQKQFDPARTTANGTPTWTGTISGDGWSGSLEARLVDYAAAGVTEHVSVLHVVDAGARSFSFLGTGMFNNVTNRIVLDGEVDAGWMAGARVHDEAVRTDAASSRYVGTYRLSG